MQAQTVSVTLSINCLPLSKVRFCNLQHFVMAKHNQAVSSQSYILKSKSFYSLYFALLYFLESSPGH